MIRTLKPGDQIRYRPSGTVREIVDVRRTGYGWRYPDMGQTTPSGGENYWWSENSTDPFFEGLWDLVPDAERVAPPTGEMDAEQVEEARALAGRLT